ncbi:hypothetical protein GQ54DRAFT_304584 [Martensiomyces pterosporus]|nr:hypothetical protein GQ54DRAFT_304584 [Martensiomyces pterosporus]
MKRGLAEQAEATPAAKRPAHSHDHRCSTWTDAEKERVFEKLRRGRVSAVEIAKHVGKTKSLRQVAEYLEYLQFWSHALGDHANSDDTGAGSDEECTTESSDEEGTAESSDEEAAALLEAKADDHDMLKKSKLYSNSIKYVPPSRAPAAVRKHNTFNSGFGNLLAKLVYADDRAQVVPTTFIHLYVDLVVFLRKVLVEVAIRSAVTGETNTSYMVPRTGVKKHTVRQALRSCGFDRGKPAPDLLAALLDKYLDKGVDLDSMDTDRAAGGSRADSPKPSGDVDSSVASSVPNRKSGGGIPEAGAEEDIAEDTDPESSD